MSSVLVEIKLHFQVQQYVVLAFAYRSSRDRALGCLRQYARQIAGMCLCVRLKLLDTNSLALAPE